MSRCRTPTYTYTRPWLSMTTTDPIPFHKLNEPLKDIVDPTTNKNVANIVCPINTCKCVIIRKGAATLVERVENKVCCWGSFGKRQEGNGWHGNVYCIVGVTRACIARREWATWWWKCRGQDVLLALGQHDGFRKCGLLKDCGYYKVFVLCRLWCWTYWISWHPKWPQGVLGQCASGSLSILDCSLSLFISQKYTVYHLYYKKLSLLMYWTLRVISGQGHVVWCKSCQELIAFTWKQPSPYPWKRLQISPMLIGVPSTFFSETNAHIHNVFFVEFEQNKWFMMLSSHTSSLSFVVSLFDWWHLQDPSWCEE